MIMTNLLYIHGMGGGGDSRIPSILQSATPADINVVVRTYSFDPEFAHDQIASWVEEIKPALIIGESLGSLHTIRIPGIPHLYVSPALNAPFYFELMAWLALIPGVSRVFDKIYKPRKGDRQALHFSFRTLRKYIAHRKDALSSENLTGLHFAFFGKRDHYRKSGVVSIRTWVKHFGNAYSVYDGTHFMEEEFIFLDLLPKIYEVLNNNK